MSNEPFDFDEIGQRIENFLDGREELRHLVPGFNAVRDAVQKAAGASTKPPSPKGEGFAEATESGGSD